MPWPAKLGMAVVALAWGTTLLLPNRQTVPAINAGRQFVTGVLGTAMGTAKPANP